MLQISWKSKKWSSRGRKKIFKNLRRSPYFSHLLTKGMRVKKNDIIFLRPYSPKAIKINMIKKY